MSRLRAEVVVKGIVQGVGFRPFIYRNAVEKGLKGYVRNLGDATVKIVIEGERDEVSRFLEDLKDKNPPLARIYDLFVRHYSETKHEFEAFSILDSSETGEKSGSIIPPDVAICNECSKELKDPYNRRFNYFFITCTDCGPRYTAILRTPYDRPNTTMRRFSMCERCGKEYIDPRDRRFHAQTIACPTCGPKVYLTTSKGEAVECRDAIQEAGKLLTEGYIVAVKGNGGFHLATAATVSRPIIRLRRVKYRSQKPFAVMARDIKAVKSFATVSDEEADLLTSYIRPILLLRKSEDYYLAQEIAPGLHNIGVMLPYSGLHILLLENTDEPALIMTSGNRSGEPIVKDNEDALKRLSSDVDYFLFHDRGIAQRCDDSVVRVVDGEPCPIRRSRGYAPEPIRLKVSGGRCTLGLGGELNITACVLLEGRAYVSQHIGDMEEVETFLFLKEAAEHLVKLTKSPVEVVAHDLHPRFLTTKLAGEFEEERGWRAIAVQHHHAHIASLMGEHGLNEVIGIACDGVGYGSDGAVWGGEILECFDGGFRRRGHLQEHPMVGSDLATKYPARMVAGIMLNSSEAEEWLFSNVELFPYGQKEVELIFTQLKRGRYVKTTSCGRVLDAVSTLLGICQERTYEGEPAMKLESAATYGRDALNLEPIFKENTLNTRHLLEQIFDHMQRLSKADLAYSAQSYIARGLALLAVEKAEELGYKTIGLSGGVAYNEQITSTIRKVIENSGIKFITNLQVPPGDGGLSFGQTVAVASMDF